MFEDINNSAGTSTENMINYDHWEEVVESISNPMLITREMLLTARISDQKDEVFGSEKNFQEYFQQKLKTNKYSLLIDRKVTMAELEIIVNDGLKLPDLLIPYHSDLKALNDKKDIETRKLEKKLQDDMNIINKIACKILEETYKIFEKFISLEQEEENSIIDDKTVKRINQSYNGIQTEIYEAISYIDHTQWNDYKARFIFAQNYSSNNLISNNSITHEPIENTIVDIFSEKDIFSLIDKYTKNTNDQRIIKRLTNYVKGGSSNVDDIVQGVKDRAKKIKDNEFVQEILKNTGDNSEYIIQQFHKCYQDWKKTKFPKIINSIIQKHVDGINRKSDQIFETKREQIYKKNFQSICDQIESNCSTGNLLKVLGVKITDVAISDREDIVEEFHTKLSKIVSMTSCEEQHTIHKCHGSTCPIVCYVKNCEEICENSDHLHAFGKIVNHICGTCHFRCDKCNKKCQKTNRHDAGHDCSTDHKCHAKCQFTNSDTHFGWNLPECNLFADHEGMHRCIQMHSCEAPCVHADKKNCQKRCAKNALHPTTEKHLCEVKEHYCGAPCSLNVKTHGGHKCQNTCIIPCDEEHTVHKCQGEMCPIKCSFENCKRFCESLDHLHALKENANHICGNCKSNCVKVFGHQEKSGNETHLCESNNHYCGAPCSLIIDTINGKYHCPNICILTCEKEHTLHRCLRKKCPIKCSIEGCEKYCENSDHLHALDKKMDHLCRCNARCFYMGKENCLYKCAKLLGHEDKTHLCESNNHFCGAQCSLLIDTPNEIYKCNGVCNLACEKEHTTHKCQSDKCPVECGIKDCGNPCNFDHFHGFEQIVNHLCGNCRNTCANTLCHRGDHLCKAKKHYCGVQCTSSDNSLS
ncbi:4375_t:CDS:10 [Diversispora eburnea]|uniref:4375_t:CDS:1 n=1 Tax=Diversispora eburnea TaxID=1213867 RepID=A0A9N8V5U2_9GLOM|nr:4375_t:CDS:10 [Diversispora eburnea]